MKILSFLATLALPSALAFAQSANPGELTWGLQVGSVTPLGKADKVMNTGFTATFDITYNLSPALRLRTELGWAESRAKIPYNTQGIGATIQAGSLTENVVLPLTSNLPVEFTFIGGLGAHRVTGQLDQSIIVPGGYYDPWWGIWYPVAVGSTQVLASRTTTKLGYNAGFGVAYRVSPQVSMTLEIRYTRIETKPTLEYLPITLGVRF